MKKESAVSLLYILASVFIISGPLYTGYYFYKQMKAHRRVDPKYNITAIEQFSEKKLPAEYFAELLGLSFDRPFNLYCFDEKKAAESIMSQPQFLKVEVEKQKPDRIVIDFELRKPLFRVADFENALIDNEGVIYPGDFWDEKSLPLINLGLSSYEEKASKEKEFALALNLYELLLGLNVQFAIERIDVSNAFSQSYGRREALLFIRDELVLKKGEKKMTAHFPMVVRFSTKNYEKQLGNFFSLLKQMKADYAKQLALKEFSQGVIEFKPKMIDMRIAKLAFVD